MAVIRLKRGAEIQEIATSQNGCENTIRNWLDRFGEQPIEQAPYDEPGPGRPSKLEPEQREAVFEALHESPAEYGYGHQAWSPTLLVHSVTDVYDVKYSQRHARYLLNEAGRVGVWTPQTNHSSILGSSIRR